MKKLARLAPLAGIALFAAAQGAAAPQGAMPGVTNPRQAEVDYMLKCRGCHQPGGEGNQVNTPPLHNQVARFLGVPGGREFLGRVPGVASTDLDDVRLAQLLNWTLYRFDAGHLPANFTPYTPAEMRALRQEPLRLERLEARNRLVAALGDKNFK